MASVTNLKKGSKGSDVTTLQELLNKNGYTLDVDGVFGSKTQAAVRDYQAKSGLTVDGIAGEKTYAALTGRNANNMWSSPIGGSSYSYSGGSPYLPSSSAAYSEWQSAEAAKPGAYQSKYTEQIDGLLNQIMNRGEFRYDFNADPLYQQMRDRYTQQGQLAMMDAMGNAAALSGGYGNSYVQTVGQQTFQGYLQGVNDSIPALRDAAYQMYLGEGERLNANLNTLRGLDDTDYGRYRDTVSDYYTNRDYYGNKYYNLYDREYQAHQDALARAAAAQVVSSGSSKKSSGSSKKKQEQSGMTLKDAVRVVSRIAGTEGAAAAKAEAEYIVNSGLITDDIPISAKRALINSIPTID